MSDQAALWPMGESFWPKDSLITHILFELCLFKNLAQCTLFLLTLYVCVSIPLNYIAFRKKPIICVVSWVGKVIVQVSGIAYTLQTVAERNSILLPSVLNSILNLA